MARQDCMGHPPGEFDAMGETVYCDGSCRPLCSRCKQLHAFPGGDLCEPCWEIGRDEPGGDAAFEQALGEGRR